jgi:hypothetical protein
MSAVLLAVEGGMRTGGAFLGVLAGVRTSGVLLAVEGGMRTGGVLLGVVSGGR